MANLLSFWSLSCQVTSQDKAPSVISRVLKKNNRDSAVASEYELVQLLPGERGERPRRKSDLGGEGCPAVGRRPQPGGCGGNDHVCSRHSLSEHTELTIPPSANVFYAMDGASHDFLLRQRRRPSLATLGLTSSPSASGTPPSEGGGGSFPRIKATGRKIARALF